jgi:hypothetical protein
MHELSLIVRILWYVTTAMKALALLSMARKRLIGRYPVFCAGLAISCAGSLWLGYEWITAAGGPDQYRDAYRAVWHWFQPVELAVIAMWALDAHIVQGRYIPGFGKLSAILSVLFLLISMAAVAITAGIGSRGYPGYPALILITRHFDLACLVFVAISRSFFAERQTRAQLVRSPWTMPQNVVKHTHLLMLLFAGNAIGHGLDYTGNPWLILTGMFIMFSTAIAAYAGWAKMNPAGEQWTPPPEMSVEEFQARSRQHYMGELWDILRDISRRRRTTFLGTSEGRWEADWIAR